MRNGYIRIAGIGLAALGMTALTGCKTGETYDELYETNRSLTNRNQELQAQNESLRTRNNQLEGALAGNASGVSELERMNRQLSQELQASQNDLRNFGNRFNQLSLSPLDAETNAALMSLAERYGDVVSYDPQRGMLRFESDLTFASGSADVQPGAKSSLRALSEILTTSAGSNYELQVIGHTDSQRISSGTARRHPTNMHLAAHRAIGVRQELVSMGVPPDRVFAGGWGEYRPVVANTATGNTPANRRVEIFLTASSAEMITGNDGTAVEIDRRTTGVMEIEPTK